MAESSREIKRRMASISNTQQITRAMEMIAGSKLRNAQETVIATRPYYERLTSSLGTALRAAEDSGENLPEVIRDRNGESYCLLVFTGDRGLAGGYNAAIVRRAEQFLQEHPGTEMVLVGRKARDHFRRRNQTSLAEFVGLGDQANLRTAQDIGHVIFDFFEHRLFDRVSILYTEYINTVTHRVKLRPVLPLPVQIRETQRSQLEPLYLYEPSIHAVLETLLPLYVNAAVYQALTEAKASELGARMTAMRNATDNAGELIRELRITYNRARQAQITREIAEIVGGADALQS